MKHGICWIVLAALCMGLVGCASDEKTQKPVYRKKIYLTEQDYLDDLAEDPNAERREAKPSIES